MPAALHADKKKLYLGWPIVALIALLGFGSWSGGNLAAALNSPAVDRSYVGADDESAGTFCRLEAARIRYSQSTYSLYGKTEEGGFYSVEENIQWLKDHPDEDLPWGGPIRVFRKQAFMDDWGPLSHEGFTGDPKNLQNGKIYTLDHRRLVAYRLAGRKTIPAQWASLSVVRDNRWKFTTMNGGRSIAPKPEVLQLRHCRSRLSSVCDPPLVPTVRGRDHSGVSFALQQ